MPQDIPHDPRLDLAFSRVVDVPRAKVWRCWTEPELLKPWFCPKPWTTPECEIDLRPGGVFRTVLRSPEGEEHGGDGCYLEVVPERRLVWTSALGPGFRPVPPPAAETGAAFVFTATLSFEDEAGGTRYTAVVLHATEAGRAAHAAMGFETGWSAALDQLVAFARTLPG